MQTTHKTQPHKKLPAWFLGPKGENRDQFKRLVTKFLDEHCDWRAAYFPQDHSYITPQAQETEEYKEQMARIEDVCSDISLRLRNSTPFFSSRYKGHMNWDISLPGLVGYFTTMLYNPNNVASEASPVTTELEHEVGHQLCQLIGFEQGWAHITCDGSVANIEAMWAARNVKYYAQAIQTALKKEKEFQKAQNIEIETYLGKKKLIELSEWDILNVNIDVALDIPNRLQSEFQIPKDIIEAGINKYDVQHLGMPEKKPLVFVPATRHYSWDKGAAVLGFGMNNMIQNPTNTVGQIEVDVLRQQLDKCLQQKTPVALVVVIAGTTAESAVDPIAEVVELRKEFRKKGLEFAIHADAAWGGYMRSTIIPIKKVSTRALSSTVVALPLSEYVVKQLEALKECDTVTADPHKSGFIQYPAGSLSYKNQHFRFLLTFTAPIISSTANDGSMGIYGIEGSKPGAAVVATWVSHQVIGLNSEGYGLILSESNFTTKRLYSIVVTMAAPEDPFVIVPFNPITPENVEKLRKKVIGKLNEEILEDNEALNLLRNVGPDLLINAFSINFKVNGKINTDPDLHSKFMDALAVDLNITRLSTTTKVYEKGNVSRKRLFLIRDTLEQGNKKAVERIAKGLGLENAASKPMKVLVNSNMDPWPTASGVEFMELFQSELRKAILRAIGTVTDTPDLHGFVISGTEGNVAYGDHLPMLEMQEHWYQAIIKVEFPDNDPKVKEFLAQKGPLVFGNKQKATLASILASPQFQADCFVGVPEDPTKNIFLTTTLKVVDVIWFERFDFNATAPKNDQYILYGSDKVAMMSHQIIDLKKLRFEVIQLPHVPEEIAPNLIQQGITISVDETDPKKPLPLDKFFNATFKQAGGALLSAKLRVKPESIIYSDSTMSA